MSIVQLASEKLKERFPEMVRSRRYLHQNPELSFQESATSDWIAERLAQSGCMIRRNVGGYGIVATIKGGLPGPTVALRADIDALPIQDEKTCDYASKVPNVMHACGHDGHTATLLAVADFYSSHADQLAGERRLLFQPAEEVTPGGAAGMIEAGAIDGAEAIYGVHLWTPLAYGLVGTKSGAFMSAADEFVIDIEGKGGHGGLPHQTVDTVVVGAAIVQAVQTIVSRNIDPLQPAVVSIGSFQAGSTTNIIAEKCRLKGTVRSFNETTRRAIHERLEAIVRQTCAMFGAKCELQLRIGYPPLVNDDREAERMFRVAEERFGRESVAVFEPITVAEDFSYYLERIPGCFVAVGAGNPACGASYPHHHPKFDIDERAMLTAAELLVALAEDFAQERRA